MLYTTDTIPNIDFSKYKRFFAFGCSFTQYRWPTWADVIANELPLECDYHNQGNSGAGQTYIMSMLSQAKKYYNIGKDDLVGIMWSTFFREDRYNVNWGGWKTPGNILSQNLYPDEYLHKYSCLLGYTIRDLAIVDTTVGMLESAEFDSFSMWGVSPTNQLDCVDVERLTSKEEAKSVMLDSVLLYHDLSLKVLPDMFTFLGNQWPVTFEYSTRESHFYDYHPSTTMYHDYLKHIGVPLSDNALDYARKCDAITHSFKTIDKFEEYEEQHGPFQIL